MKTTIIISLLIICSVCKGQYPEKVGYSDSNTVYHNLQNISGAISSASDLKRYEDSCHCLLGTGYVTYGSNVGLTTPVYDTIKVQMICSSDDEQNNKVVKIIGYEVREKQWVCCDPHNNQLAAFYWDYNHIKYLDIVKQDLGDKITVWMCKEIK